MTDGRQRERDLMAATEAHWQDPELLAVALAEAWSAGHAAGMADGLVLGAEGEQRRRCGTCDHHYDEHHGAGECAVDGKPWSDEATCEQWAARR